MTMDTEVDLIDLYIDDTTVIEAKGNSGNVAERIAETSHVGNTHQAEFCKKCNMAFADWNAFFIHKLSAPDVHMCCYFCGKDFNTPGGTVRHQRQDHAAEQNLSCVGCNTRFNRVGAYVSHIEHRQCLVIHKSDFDKMRNDKESQQGAKLITNIPLVSEGRGNVQRSWENWPSGRTEMNRQALAEKDFPVLTAGGKNPSISKIPNKIYNKHAHKEGAKELPTGGQKKINQGYLPYDPSNPEFDASKYYNEFCDASFCPWPGCKKQLKTSASLTQHLKAHIDTNSEILRCPSCLTIFNSATALVQHSESQAIKCNIRESYQFRQAIDQMTGGLVDVDPLDERHFDNTIKYTAGKIMTSVDGHLTIADASAAYWAEQEERRKRQIKEMEKTAKW